MSKFIVERTPTLLPSMMVTKPMGRCAVCGEVICEDDRVIVLDNEKMVHEKCAVFQKDSLTEFLDLLGIDYYTGTAKEVAGDG